MEGKYKNLAQMKGDYSQAVHNRKAINCRKVAESKQDKGNEKIAMIGYVRVWCTNTCLTMEYFMMIDSKVISYVFELNTDCTNNINWIYKRVS